MSDDPDASAEADATADPDAEPPENESPDRPMSTDTIDATATTDQPEDSSDPDDDTIDLVRYARYALLGGLTLLALVATLRFYFAASNAIDIWVARQYRPLFQAAFNLVVLLVAAVGISWELRKVAG